MQIVLEPRAEIAIRSLPPREKKQVAHAISVIRSVPFDQLSRMRVLYRLIGTPHNNLYEYRVGERLRLVLSFQGDTCTIEDVVDPVRLERLVPVPAQQ